MSVSTPASTVSTPVSTVSTSASTVSSHIAGILVDAALSAGAGTDRIAQLLGWDPELLRDRSFRIPVGDVSRLWGLLYTLAGPRAGVLAADRAEHGRLYVWDYLISNAPTLADGLREAARFNTTICDPKVGLEVIEDGSLLTARYFDLPHREPLDALVREFAAVVTARRAVAGFGDAGIPVRVEFSHSAPADRGYLVRALGTGNIHFDQPRDAITFLGTGAPVRPNDPLLQGILREHAERMLESGDPEPPWLEAFRRVLRARLSDRATGGARLDEVAKRLGVSERTLQRRLADHRTTWRVELETVRRDLAIALLRNGSDSIQSIALQLGYRDHRVLARAFRRWTGQSPAGFRRAIAN
ncbi:helix-turn-helix domain-containing protein [Nocardia sp. ET3-3]|uniref:Helix-turn-helix domain-containing protein n=1 Tax=Nocardia terrae TaxID=2675851 RepID=A0A7K1V5P1_9NOCA|nr:AraC family transcriptional regulator [Nocardia terrae]MVU81779.1 helix-turn-helix domain-containing protein [Nocardia terrae]